ncbi:hypothetical protein Bbelb_231790 [Branchiostoma belcheri]|nr:hypothetical protein Bbelb_231790 [Branchiostoma belcheri]
MVEELEYHDPLGASDHCILLHGKTIWTYIRLHTERGKSTSLSIPLGIIQTVMLNYRKLQLNRTVSDLQKDKEATGMDIVKKITVLDAIRWVDKAWKKTGAMAERPSTSASGNMVSSPQALL